MALAYAFVDERGVYRGGSNRSPRGVTEFLYMPLSGPFAGQSLVIHATSWDGFASGTWLSASNRWGCFATTEVEELLGMEPTDRSVIGGSPVSAAGASQRLPASRAEPTHHPFLTDSQS